MTIKSGLNLTSRNEGYNACDRREALLAGHQVLFGLGNLRERGNERRRRLRSCHVTRLRAQLSGSLLRGVG